MRDKEKAFEWVYFEQAEEITPEDMARYGKAIADVPGRVEAAMFTDTVQTESGPVTVNYTTADPIPPLTIGAIREAMAEIENRIGQLPRMEIQIGEGQTDSFGRAVMRLHGGRLEGKTTAPWEHLYGPANLMGIPIIEHSYYPAGMGVLLELSKGAPRAFGSDWVAGVPLGWQVRFILDWRSGSLSVFALKP